MPAAEPPRGLRHTVHEAEEELRGAQGPRIGRARLGFLVRQVIKGAEQDALLAFAGNLTYNAFLALFPFLLFLLSILKAVHATGLITYLVTATTRSLPAPAAHLVRQQIVPDVVSRLTESPLLSLCLALGSLWAVSFLGRAIVQAVNRMYDVEDTRPLWQRFFIPLAFVLGAAALFVGALVLIVFGSALGVGAGRLLGSGSTGWWAWYVLRWPVLVALAFLGFALVYYCAPDLEQRAPFVSLGAALATAAWLLFSAGFSLVLNNFAQFLVSPLYGWFTGLIILLMYIYWSSVIVLLGAEVNRAIEEQV